MVKLNIAVVFGGYSTEHEISIKSSITVLENLSEDRFNIIPIYICDDGKWHLYDGGIKNIRNINPKYLAPITISLDRGASSILRLVGEKIKPIKIDVAFPVLHGQYGEDGAIQGVFEMAGIPYLGCGILASAVAMDKVFSKMIAAHLNIPTAKYLSFHESEFEKDPDANAKLIRTKLGYPCFVKPSNAGSSVGISKVKNKKQLLAAVEEAFALNGKIIIERKIVGRELECAVVGSFDEVEVSDPGEILTPEEFYDYDAKYNNPQSQNIIPAEVDPDIVEQIKIYSEKLFRAIEGRGFARIDFFLEEKTGKLIFNEINTLPGLTSVSMFPKLAATMGMNMEDFLEKLVAITIREYL